MPKQVLEHQKQEKKIKYEEIEQFLIDQIQSQIFKSDDNLPSENKLAQQFSVSRMTARKALENLENMGLVYKIKGSGTFVRNRHEKHEIFLDDIMGFNARVQKDGINANTQVLKFEILSPPHHILTKLRLAIKSKVFYIERIRFIDNIPVIFEKSYMPYDMCQDLSPSQLEISKYAYAKAKGFIFKHIFKEYIAIRPDKNLKAILGLNNNSALFEIDLSSELSTGEIFEYTKIYYNQDKYKFVHIIHNYE